MRLKSAIWVSAYSRRRYVEGVPVAVVRRGAEEAGAICIKVSRLDGTADVRRATNGDALRIAPKEGSTIELFAMLPPITVTSCFALKQFGLPNTKSASCPIVVDPT